MDFLEKKLDYRTHEIASVYDEVSVWASRFGHLLLDHIPLQKNIIVADIACGPGFPLFELANRLGNSCTLYGIDPWEEAIDRACFKKDTYQLDNVILKVGTVEALPLADQSVDYVVSNLGINSFEDPAKALSECKRVLKPEGKLFLCTNTQGHMKVFYEVYRKVLVELGKQAYLDRLQANIKSRVSVKQLSDWLAQAGFSISQLIENIYPLSYVDGSALLRSNLTILGFLGGWRKVVDPQDEVSIFRVLETRLNEIAAEKGELRLEVPMLFVEASKPKI